MRKIRHIFCILVCFYFLFCSRSVLIPGASAASELTASESCIEFIKKVEGFSSQPYYDYNQHTVGYGTKCPSDKYFDYLANGIPKEEAEVLLQETIKTIEDSINRKLIDKYHLTLNQHQFDALVSFTFNIGTGWMTYDSTLRNAIVNNAAENELVYAFSLYCTAGGKYSSGLITRRLCEANIFLNGIYSQTINDAYGYVFYEANGGTLTYRVQGFVCDQQSAPAANAIRNGDVFLGWYTNVTGGSQVTALDQAVSGKTLFSRWQSSENAENQESSSTIVNVTGDVVNIRNGPGTNYGITTRVYQNDILVVSYVTYLTNMKWGKVQDGWICLDYTNYDDLINGNEQVSNPETVPETAPPVTEPEQVVSSPSENPEKSAGTVRVNDLLRIRSGPGTTYSTVGYLFNGNHVEILEQRIVGLTVWGRTTRGWVSMDYVVVNTENVGELPLQETVPDHSVESDTPSDSTPKEESEAANVQDNYTVNGTIIADALRIRSDAGTNHSIVGFYYQNESVVVTEKTLVDSVYWGKTNQGWINMDYVQTDTATDNTSDTSSTGRKIVIADCLRVRKGIGTDHRIAQLLYYGDTIDVLETKNVDGTLWGRVYNGWICMDYVS